MAAKSEAAAVPELLSGPMEITIIDAGNPSRKQQTEGGGATVRTTGLTRLDRGGTNLLDGLAKSKGFGPHEYKVKLGGNAKTGFVAIYPVDPNTVGSVAISRDKRYKLVTVYLHDLFDDPDMDGLAPTETRRCMAAQGTDAKGNTCLMIGLKSALEKRTKSTAKKQSSAPKSQTP